MDGFLQTLFNDIPLWVAVIESNKQGEPPKLLACKRVGGVLGMRHLGSIRFALKSGGVELTNDTFDEPVLILMPGRVAWFGSEHMICVFRFKSHAKGWADNALSSMLRAHYEKRGGVV